MAEPHRIKGEGISFRDGRGLLALGTRRRRLHSPASRGFLGWDFQGQPITEGSPTLCSLGKGEMGGAEPPAAPWGWGARPTAPPPTSCGPSPAGSCCPDVSEPGSTWRGGGGQWRRRWPWAAGSCCAGACRPCGGCCGSGTPSLTWHGGDTHRPCWPGASRRSESLGWATEGGVWGGDECWSVWGGGSSGA